MEESRWLAASSFALAAGLAAVAVLGPLLLGVVQYRYSETMLNQARGLDAFTLVVVAPLAATAGVLALRQHPAAPVLALAPAGFAAYMLVQYVVGPEYLVIDGNGERFFLLFVALFTLAGVVALQAWALATMPPSTVSQDRRRGVLLLLLAAFVVAGMYLANGFLAAMADFPAYVSERATSSEYDEHPTAFWLVATLDLAIVVPLTVAVGIGQLRGSRWARQAYYAIIGWFALVPGSVAAMAVVMVARDDAAADAPRAFVLCVAAVVFAALALRSFRPLFHHTPAPAAELPERQHEAGEPGGTAAAVPHT